jgi:uncharacterized protein
VNRFDLDPRKPPPKADSLGVGFGCHLALPVALYTSELLDFVEITPEVYHRAENIEGAVRLVPEPKLFDAARTRCGSLPITMHSVSLSIGSAHGMYEPCLTMMDHLKTEWPFRWYSEHLQFQSTPDEHGKSRETGIPFPLPATNEVAELVADRASFIQDRYGVPFLLENPAHYLADLPADPEIGDEFGLMQAILQRSGCGQLLDLHNLYCNAVNFNLDPAGALSRISMDPVGEIHIAGGSWRDGFYMDAHDGRVPEAVWDLLEQALSRARCTPAVVFEILDEYLGRIGPDAIAQELERARNILQRRHAVAETGAWSTH